MWLGSITLILIALYMQYYMGLEPCALCMTQRVFIIAVGVVALLGWLHNFIAPNSKLHLKVYGVLGMLLAIIGGGFSSRHLWLQSLPEDLVPACGPSLGYLIDTVPFAEALSVLLQGDGHCADVSWSFLGLTIPGWTLVTFIGFFLIYAYIFYRAFQRKNALI
jgi:disulfide bond formation protein DsbB